MTPHQINELHGENVWTCVQCKTIENLHWWNGLSVAICNDKKCKEDWSAKCYEERQQQEAYEAYAKEIYGD
jgi:hypothetical protein